MTNKAKPYTTIAANVSNELKEQLTHVAEVNGNTLSLEITQRLQFTLEWAGNGSVDALGKALNTMSPDTFARLAIGAEQLNRMNAGTYKCAQYENISKIREITARDRDALSEQITPKYPENALSDPSKTAAAPDLKITIQSLLKALFYETDFDLSAKERSALKPDFKIYPSGAMAIIIDVCNRWVKSVPENDDTREARRALSRHCHAGELLSSIGVKLIDFYVYHTHESLSFEAMIELRKAGLKNGDPLNKAHKKMIDEWVDRIDKKTTETIESYLPAHGELKMLGTLAFTTRLSIKDEDW